MKTESIISSDGGQLISVAESRTPILKNFPPGMEIPNKTKVVRALEQDKDPRIAHGHVVSMVKDDRKIIVKWDYPADEDSRESYEIINGSNMLAPEDYIGFIKKIHPYIPPNAFNETVAINCGTESEAAELCYLLDYYGATWQDGSSYLENTYWSQNRQFTCYNVSRGTYGHIKAFKLEGCRVIEFSKIK